MWKLNKGHENVESVITIKCNEHERLISKLSRIEGENFVIIAMLTAILIFVLERFR